ncbi:MAG: polysaccharide deacetylase family protein [Limnochordia bacterium]|jgi:polysaccharide deacetylase family sporulation protein PdaB|nr:polysaccharide deacetylase family protein [Limnochordia bacterium]MDD2630052.1 polysaccharide deacetylase family protein [Limnochordia bacterium]MDD2756752.1 polysaccharide deacetylase family protein [Methanothrix sp.]MDD4517773.1 polysaccharide deacetylase family protein [Limnochordia bacterium]
MSVFYLPKAHRNLLFIVLGVVLLVNIYLVSKEVIRPVMGLLTGRLVPIYGVDTPEKKISLTFDATWGNEYTEGILTTLQQYNIKSTFFLCGYWLEKYPTDVKRIAALGHEIGNHSYTHPHMNSLSRAQIVDELMLTHDLIKGLTGQSSTVFRPPFGEYNNTLIETAAELGYYTIQWSVDSLDWKDVTADYIYNRIMGSVKPGDIILMHNNGRFTADVIKRLIPDLLGKGYQFVSVSELIYKDNYIIEPHSGLQRTKKQIPSREGR